MHSDGDGDGDGDGDSTCASLAEVLKECRYEILHDDEFMSKQQKKRQIQTHE